MKFKYGTLTASFTIGIYLTNWGYPIDNDWEFGFYLFKWYIGVGSRDS